MSEKRDDNQYRLTDYQHDGENNDESMCRVCGFESNDTASVENCHPDTRLDRERNTAVTDPQSGHTGFVIPPYMDSTARNLLEEIRAATEHTSEKDVLPPAADALVQHFPVSMTPPTAFQVFTHLIWLQQYQALPGYPIRTDPSTTDRIPIPEFCNTADFDGTVTTDQVRDAAQLERQRIYRAKVLSVTDAFFETSPVADNVRNAAEAASRWAEIRFPASIPFAAGTAHNTVVRETRNWLATHPDIDWACAPHTMGVPRQPTGNTQSSVSDDSSTGTVSMFDFAAFTEQPDPEVAVIGCVLGSDEIGELITKIEQIRETTAAALIVIRTRKGIHRVIEALDATEWLDTAAAPTDEVSEYYARQPSIQAVTEEFAVQVPEMDHVQFVTGKQLIDDIITPVDVFPEQFQKQATRDR